MNSKVEEKLVHTFEDGQTVEIEADPQRIHGAVWANGAAVMVSYYPQAQAGYDESDRLRLVVHEARGKKLDVMLNVEDAMEIMQGLSRGVGLALADNVPVKPVVMEGSNDSKTI